MRKQEPTIQDRYQVAREHLGALEAEQAGIEARVNDTALAGDQAGFFEAYSRRARLPYLITEAKAALEALEVDYRQNEVDRINEEARPHKERLAALQEEIKRLTAQANEVAGLIAATTDPLYDARLALIRAQKRARRGDQAAD